MLKYGCDVGEDIPRKMKVEERTRSRADKHKKTGKALSLVTYDELTKIAADEVSE